VGGSSYKASRDEATSSFAPSCCYAARSAQPQTPAVIPAVYGPLCTPAVSSLFTPEYGYTTNCPYNPVLTNGTHMVKNDNWVVIGTAESRYLGSSTLARPQIKSWDKKSYWHCSWAGGGRPQILSMSPTKIVLDVAATLLLSGTGLSRADKIKLIEPSSYCHGREDEDALLGGSGRHIEWASADRLNATITFTIYRPQLTNGDLVPAIACYLYDGASEYTQFSEVTLVSNPTWWPETEKPVDPTYGLVQPQVQTRQDGRLVTNVWQQFT